MRLFYNFISLSLSMTPIIILLLCFVPILKKRYSAKWRYLLWATVSLRMLLPYSYTPKLFKKQMTGVILPSATVTAGQLSINTSVLNNVNSLGNALFVIYFAGVILYLVHEIFSYAVFHRDILRWGRKTSKNEIQSILNDEKERLNIKRNVPVLISKKVSSPMLAGLINPKLFLPTETYTNDELRMILSHELIHLKRNDILIKTIIMLVSAAHWFNPAVHFMARQAIKDMEQSCDDYVLNGADVEGKKFYCGIILKMAVNNRVPGHVFSTNIISSRKNLESRINDIFDNSRKKRGRAELTALILIFAIFGTVINVSGAEQPKNNLVQVSSLNEQAEVKNENEIISEKKAENKFENSQSNLPDENMQNAENESEPADLTVIDDTQMSNIPEDYSDTQDFAGEDDITEIVIVDLNQLENQLQGSEIADNSNE